MPRAAQEGPGERDRRDLVALADGALPARRRAAVEARVGASPELAASLRRQRRAIAALHAVEAPAPQRLRTKLAAERPEPDRRLPRLAWVGAAAGAVAAAVVAVVLLGGGASAPTIDDAAELAALPPTEPAPERRPGQPTLLAAEAEGLAYPDWSGEFGWRASGQRADRVGDREATTVYYENEDGNRIAYTIVSGESLGRPPGARTTTVEGVEFAVARDGPRTTVTWLRDGHSCVLSGEDTDSATLVELAAWRGDGAVAF